MEPAVDLAEYPTGGKLYLAQARGPDGPNGRRKAKRITVGRHPVLGAEDARQRAALIIARIKAGEDPVPLPLRRSTPAARRWPTWPRAISRNMSRSAASRKRSGRPAA